MSGPNRVLGSVSDMMAGLMIVFLFLLVCYMARTQGTSQDLLKTRDRADTLEEELKLYKKQNELKESDFSKKMEEKERQKNILEEILVAQRLEKTQSESEKNEIKTQLEETENQLLDLKKQKTEAEKQIEKVKQDSLRYFQTQTAIAKCLKTEFQNDLLTWGASVEPDGTVRFYNPSVLFKQNEDKLTPKGQAMLREFFGRYIKILYAPEFIEQVGEIRVEGHTSSEWAEGVTEIQRYIWNLDLSQRRAFEILRICLPSIDDPKVLERVKGQAIATGHSYSKTVRNQDNSENRELSRRVEFKAITRSEKLLREMSKPGPTEE